MDLSVCLNEVRQFCQTHSDPARAQKYAHYFVEGYDAYGLDQKLMESQRRQWLQAWQPELGPQGFLQLGGLLVQSGKYEEASLAVGFAAAQKEHFTAQTLDELGGWLDQGICNWAHTDILCGELLSYLLVQHIVPVQAFYPWRAAASKWKRRAVPVSLIAGLKAGFDLPGLLDCLAPLMNDPEKVVQQGLGWFLREAWKRQPQPVEAFLLDWKETCGRTIVQYATEKMTLEQKQPFKRAARSKRTAS